MLSAPLLFGQQMDQPRVLAAYRVVLLLIAAWLAWSLSRVNIDFADAYSTIANAQYFLGDSHAYFWQRGPLLALVLLPAEWFAQTLTLHPLDVRTHHATFVTLHFLYLIGVWHLLRLVYGASWSTLMAFLAAIPTLVFFSYAPFISHDLLPGLGLLYLLWLSQQFQTRPSRSQWLLFAGLSLMLVLLKQTYALLPVCIVAARVLALMSGKGSRSAELRGSALLMLATTLAGLLSWLAYALLLNEQFADQPFLLRPFALIQRLSDFYGPELRGQAQFYPWLYLRNASAYGVLAMSLMVPALVIAIWRGDMLQRQSAFTWILLLIAMHLTPFKEVRYLAFMAPLTALTLVPVFRQIFSMTPVYRWIIGLVLALDMALVIPEALRLNSVYYKTGVSDFFLTIDRLPENSGPIFFGNGWLSFVSPDSVAFYGDPFHRITEMQIEQLRALYGWTESQAIQISNDGIPALVEAFPRSIFLIQNGFLSRRMPYTRGNLPGLQANFQQVVGTPTLISFRLEEGAYILEKGPLPPHMLARALDGMGRSLIVYRRVEATDLRHFVDLDGLPERVDVYGLRVLQLCVLEGCTSFAGSSSEVNQAATKP